MSHEALLPPDEHADGTHEDAAKGVIASPLRLDASRTSVNVSPPDGASGTQSSVPRSSAASAPAFAMPRDSDHIELEHDMDGAAAAAARAKRAAINGSPAMGSSSDSLTTSLLHQHAPRQVAVVPADQYFEYELDSGPAHLHNLREHTRRARSQSAINGAGGDDGGRSSVPAAAATGGAADPVMNAHDWSLFSLGLRMGALVLLLIWIVWDCVVDPRVHPDAHVPDADAFWIDGILPLYRASGFLVMAYWCWGVCVLVWTRSGINYQLLMALHPRTSASHQEVFHTGTTLSLLSLVNFLLWFKMQRGDFPKFGIPDGLLPVLLWLLIVGVACPWPGCGTAVKQWPRAALETLMAPFAPVTFLHVFVGDVLTSLVKPLIDCAYALCFLFSGLWLKEELVKSNGTQCTQSAVLNNIITPMLSALPLYLRLMQCFRRYRDTRERFPHMVNAGKYAVAQTVVLIGVFHHAYSKGSIAERVLWILALCASTIYSYTWDITMDWDLGSRKHKGLRGDLMFVGRWKYYSAICLDLFLRFAWSLTYVPATATSPLGTWFVKGLNPLVAALEILRRTMWAMLRVENEHLTQLSAYKRMADQMAHARNKAHALQPAAGLRSRDETHAAAAGAEHVLDTLDGVDSDDDDEDEYSVTQQAHALAASNRTVTTSGARLILEICLLAGAVLAATLVAYFVK